MADFSLDKFITDLSQLTAGGKRWDRPTTVDVGASIDKMSKYSPLAEQYAKQQQASTTRELDPQEAADLEKSRADLNSAQQMSRSFHMPELPDPGGLLTTVKNLAVGPFTNPFALSKENSLLKTMQGIGELPVGIAKSVAGNVGNLAQTFSPVDLNTVVPDKLKPYVSFPPQYSGQGQQTPGDIASGMTRNLVGAVPVVGDLANGWVDAYKKRLADDVTYNPGNANPDAKIRAAMGAAGQVVEGVMSPAVTLLSGQVPDPNDPTKLVPADTKDTYGAASNLLPMLLGGRAAVGFLEGKGMPHPLGLLEGEQIPARTLKGSLSAGEIKAADILKETMQRESIEKIGYVKGKGETGPASTGEPVAGRGPIFDNETLNGLPQKSEYPVLDQLQASKEFQTLHPEVQKHLSVEMMLEQPAYRQLVSDIIVDPVRSDAVFKFMKTGDSIYQSMARVLDDPNLTEVGVPESMASRGATPEQMQKVIAASFENTVHQGGQSLQAMSEVMQGLEDKFQGVARTGSVSERVDAQKTLKLISQWRSKTGSGSYLSPSLQASGLMEGLTQKGQQFERLRIGYMLSQVSTALHIAKSQGAIAAADLFDAFNTGLVASAGQAINEGPIAAMKNYNQNFVDLFTQIQTIKSGITLAKDVTKTGFAGVNSQLNVDLQPWLDGMPMTKGRLLTGIAAEADNTLGFLSGNYKRAMTQAVNASRNAPEGMTGAEAFQRSIRDSYMKIKELGHFDIDNKPGFVYDSAMLGADLMTAPLRMQEMFFRKMSFKSRLEANLKHIGVESDAALEQLNRVGFEDAKTKSGEVIYGKDGKAKQGEIVPIDPNLRWAIADAENHALRQTWAADPEGGILNAGVQAIRQFNSVSPLQSSMVFTPFVRAMANNVMWQAHHSPGWILDLLMPKYREAWLRPGEKMSLSESLNVQRRVGESMTGLYMLMAGVHTALGGQVGHFSKGPQPWIWTKGEGTDDQTGQAVQNTYDLRNVLPAQAAYNTIAQIMVDHMQGRDTNVTPEDVLNVLGNTRIQGIPVFNFGDAIRNAASDNDATTWKTGLAKYIGNYLGPFGNIVKTFREQYGDGLAAVPYNALVHHTIEGSPFRQPSMKNDPASAGLLRGLAPETLPDNISPFTGNVQKQTRPTEDLLAPLGAPKQLTPMEYLLSSQKGLNVQMITKPYQNTEAQNLVNKYTAKILNDPSFKPDGELQAQDWAKKMIAVNNPELSKWQLNLILPIVHKVAELQAMSEDSTKHGGGVPPNFIPQVQALLPSLGLKSVEQAWQQQLKALAHKQASQIQGQQ